MRCEPVVTVMNADDLAYLRSQIAEMPPLPLAPSQRLNGWTDESLRLGWLLSSVVSMIRSGDLEITA